MGGGPEQGEQERDNVDERGPGCEDKCPGESWHGVRVAVQRKGQAAHQRARKENEGEGAKKGYHKNAADWEWMANV